MELLIAASLSALAVIVVAIRKPWQNPARRAEGLHLLKGLRQLLEHLQQNRGLSTGYLGGDRSLKPKVDQTRASIRADLHNLDASSLSCHERWVSFTDHWSRLEGSALTLPVSDNIKQHNQNGLRSLKDAGRTVSVLLSVIETEFLSAAAPKLPATAYFDQATKAISAQFAVVDEMLLALQQRV